MALKLVLTMTTKYADVQVPTTAKILPKLPLTQYERDQLRVEAQVDRRTLAKALRGQPVSPMPLARILGALRARGLEHLIAARNAR